MLLNKRRPISIHCLEGFAYVGWQRVVCMQDDNNVTRDVANGMNKDEPPFDSLAINDGRIFYANGSMFVLSGESFSLEDLAEAIRERLGLPQVVSVDY